MNSATVGGDGALHRVLGWIVTAEEEGWWWRCSTQKQVSDRVYCVRDVVCAVIVGVENVATAIGPRKTEKQDGECSYDVRKVDHSVEVAIRANKPWKTDDQLGKIVTALIIQPVEVCDDTGTGVVFKLAELDGSLLTAGPGDRLKLADGEFDAASHWQCDGPCSGEDASHPNTIGIDVGIEEEDLGRGSKSITGHDCEWREKRGIDAECGTKAGESGGKGRDPMNGTHRSTDLPQNRWFDEVGGVRYLSFGYGGYDDEKPKGDRRY